ncbi:hypothetical protein F5882DRAFT_402916, partial [Hyaloscypha sp. PMI_1271]
MAASIVQRTLQGVVNLAKAQNQPPFVSALSWWQHAVREVCRTSNDPHAVKNALRLFPAPDNTIALLSNRGEKWLNTCLQVICEGQAIEVPLCNSPKSTARKILEIITWRPAPRPWNGDWVIEALKEGTMDITTIAEKLDFQIQEMISQTTIPGWVACCFGYPNGNTNFLDVTIKVRNELIHYAQSHGTAQLASLLNALPSQQPVLFWILSTAISCDTSSHPTISLQFIIDPIKNILAEQRFDFPVLIEYLLIIETRFRLKIVNSADITWSAPFPIDFSLWQSIKNLPPRILAESNMKTVGLLFHGISFAHIAQNDGRVRDIGENWSAYSDDILACLNVDAGVVDYVKELVELFLDSSPRNIHFATAIGSALKRWGFQPREPWAAWDIIKPDNNFAGCVELMAPGNCFPYLNRITIEVRMLLAAKASNEQLLNNISSILKSWQGIEGEMKPWNSKRRIMEVEENPKSGHFKMGGGKSNVKPRNSKRRTMEKIQEAREDTESVLFEMGQQQNTSRGFLGRRQEIEGNTKSVHFEMGEQQNTSRRVFERIRDDKENTDPVHFEMRKQQNTSLARGRLEVENTVQKRTCGSLPRLLWFLVINICR